MNSAADFIPWNEGRISITMYAEVRYLASVMYKRRLKNNHADYNSIMQLSMSYLRTSCEIADRAINNMIFGDSHKT